VAGYVLPDALPPPPVPPLLVEDISAVSPDVNHLVSWTLVVFLWIFEMMQTISALIPALLGCLHPFAATLGCCIPRFVTSSTIFIVPIRFLSSVLIRVLLAPVSGVRPSTCPPSFLSSFVPASLSVVCVGWRWCSGCC